MKNQKQSICSIIDDNDDNSYCYDSKKQIKLNQTSINNFFLSRTTSSNKTVQQHRGMKRPISADSSSTLSSFQSSKTYKDCLTSTGIKEDTVVTNDTNNQVILQNITNQKKRMVTSSSLSSENINQSSSKLKSKQQKQKQQSQLYIDFGQTNFASTNICTICNMLFVHGIQSDIQQHIKICSNYINGVLWNLPSKQQQQQCPISNSSSSPYESCLPSHDRKHNPLQQQRVCYEWIVSLKSNNNKKKKNVDTTTTTTTTTTKLNQQTITHPIQQQQQKQQQHQSKVILKWNTKNLSSTMMNKSQQQQHASIIELRPNNIGIYTNQNKLNLIRQIVNEELGFVQDDNNNDKSNTNNNQQIIYLCIMNKRVVGMVIVEEISKAYQLLEDNTRNHSIDTTRTSSASASCNKPSTTTTFKNNIGFTRSIQSCKAILGIYQLWVHTKYRYCNIASTLIDTVRKHTYYGYNNIPIELIAFSSPTESGIQFAKRYNAKNNHPNVLVYDCC